VSESAWLTLIGVVLMTMAVVLFLVAVLTEDLADDEHGQRPDPTRHDPSPPLPETD